MNEIRAKNWSHLDELLFVCGQDCKIGRFSTDCVFRGIVDASFNLKTSLGRLEGDYANREPKIIRTFQKYAHLELLHLGMNETSSIWRWLTIAQHHGLPTRLLDWTNSPYVALHFATNEVSKASSDGAIWYVDVKKTNELVSDRLYQRLKKDNAFLFTTRMLDETVPTLEEFDALPRGPFVVFFEPPSLDAIIINQFGLFSVLSSSQVSLDTWLGKHPDFYRKIIIPSGMKPEIRDKLDQVNMNERVLFPGLDGLCTWLKRYYNT